MHKAKKQLDEMIPRVQQVMSQTRERVLRGNTKAEGKLLSVFETHTEVIRKGKANKPNEFGKLVLDSRGRESDRDTLRSVRTEACRLYLTGRMSEATCRGVSGHALASSGRLGFFSAANERKAEEMGVIRVSDSEPRHQERRPKAATEAALVQGTSEMAHRL